MLASSTVCRAPTPTSVAGRAHTSQSTVGADRTMRSRRSRHMSDHYMLWGEPLRETAAFMAQVRQAAMAAGKSPPRFSLSTRPILAATDDKAWDRARDILRRVQDQRRGAPPPKPENLASQRLLSAAAAAEVHDTCLWMKLAEATGARGNSTALVGAPDTVAKALPGLLQARCQQSPHSRLRAAR